MVQPLIEMAKDLALALVKNNLLEPADMQHHLQQIHTSLRELKTDEDRRLGNREGREEGTGGTPPKSNWKKSIKKYTVECLICGETFKQLSARHLVHHNLDPRTYRQQFGIPSNQPLSAKETTAVRRRVAQESRPWEKTPGYIKAHQPAPTAPQKRGRKKAPPTSTSS